MSSLLKHVTVAGIFLSVFSVQGIAGDAVTPRALTRTLTNGMRLVVMKNSEAPLIRLRAIVDAGSKYDPADKAGLAAVTCDALTLGAGDRDALILQRHIDSLGARVTVRVGRDNCVIDATILSREVLSALKLMSDILFSPTFSESELAGVVRRRESQIYQRYDVGYPLMTDIAYETFFPGQGFGRPPTGIPGDLNRISAMDVREFHRQRYSPSRVKLVITGDFDERRLMTEAATVFLPQPRTDDERAPLLAPVSAEAEEFRIVLLDAPGQQSARVGFYALADSLGQTRKYAAERMLAHLLAGDEELSFLGRSLALKRQIITSLTGSVQYAEANGLLEIEMACARENVVDVVEETFDQFRLLRETRISKRELEDGKKYFRGSYALGFETASMANDKLIQVLGAGESYKYHDSLLQAMTSLNQEDIKASAGELFSLSRLVVVIYGDAEYYDRQLSPYGFVSRRRIPSAGE